MNKQEKGLAPAAALVILAILALLVSAGAYYLLKSAGKYPPQSSVTRPLNNSQGNGSQDTTGQEIPVSDSDKTSNIEAEVESTNIGEVESEIKGLELDADSL